MNQFEFTPIIHCFHLIGKHHPGNTIAYIRVNSKNFTKLKDGKYVLTQSTKNLITLLSRESVEEIGWTFVTDSMINERLKNIKTQIRLLEEELHSIKYPTELDNSLLPPRIS